MLHLQSPWLYELKNKRKPYLFDGRKQDNDILIIGGGIAGVTTAYFILQNTNRNVTLLEGNTIASGATGHNAGQIVTYFERPIKEIAEQYGATLAIDGQKDINSAWNLLEEIKKTVRLKTSLYAFEGLSGCVSFKPVNIHLENRLHRPEVSHQQEFCFIADDCPFLNKISPGFADLYTIVPRKVILDLLETKDSNYCAAFTAKKGCMNSAMFCEEVISYLIKHQAKRFHVYENAHVNKVILNEKTAEIIVEKVNKLTADKVILCTNGFKNIKIINRSGKTISSDYHKSLRGKIGFMKAYAFKDDNKPAAISYYNTNDDVYFYVTRRPYEISNDKVLNLLAVGGPEYFLADKTVYKQDGIYPDEINNKLNFFIQWTRINELKKKHEHEFIWHGLMGYTTNGIRLIGPDKYNPVLMYNLACNGVGILPSIYGGKKIALFLNNQVHKKSIFDPQI